MVPTIPWCSFAKLPKLVWKTNRIRVWNNVSWLKKRSGFEHLDRAPLLKLLQVPLPPPPQGILSLEAKIRSLPILLWQRKLGNNNSRQIFQLNTQDKNPWQFWDLQGWGFLFGVWLFKGIRAFFGWWEFPNIYNEVCGDTLGWLRPHISHIGMCRPQGYGFCTVLVWKCV